MKTCAYCGSAVSNKFCSYCDMELSNKYLLENGERLDNSIEHYPETEGIFKSTKDLIQLDTIELLCLLREARKYRSQVYKLRLLTHKGKEKAADGSKDEDSMNEIDISTYRDYEDATRKVWVLENIIKDRIGYFPKKITEQFLNLYLQRIKQSESKKMFITRQKIKR